MHRRLIPLTLAMVDEAEPIEGRTRLQKMVFVLQQKLVESHNVQENQLYDFFAYDYGPFSKELAEEINEMIEENLIEETEIDLEDDSTKYLYEIKSEGLDMAEKGTEEEAMAQRVMDLAQEIKTRYNNELSLSEVIEEVYSEYPEYAENSVY